MLCSLPKRLSGKCFHLTQQSRITKKSFQLFSTTSKVLDEEQHKTYVKSVGKSHGAPKEFTYCLKLSNYSEFVDLLKKEKNQFIGNFEKPDGSPIFLSGENKINDTDMWVVNQDRQGYNMLWFKSREEAVALWDYVHDKVPPKLLRNPQYSTVKSIHKYTGSGWKKCNNYSERNAIDLIGYSQHMNVIQKDILNCSEYTTFLKSIGEGSRTLNYLLVGPPGTGKTTLIKTLASRSDLPIYIVNASNMRGGSVSDILNPKDNTATKIVLFEDFDRYLKESNYSMSEILNELDGIESTEGVVRFFTANNVDEVMKHEALINRMSAKFEFHMPNIEHFAHKLDRFLTFYPTEWRKENQDKISAFMKLVETQCVGKLTLRPFNNYVIRYLFDTNCIDSMIAHIGELK